MTTTSSVTTTPAVSEPEFNHAGQAYSFVRVDPHTCRDGRSITLDVYRTQCAKCGQPFEVKIGTPAARKWPSRRCLKHRRPGVKA